jgi:mono/diheme cytochrome c family protein
MMRTRVAVYCAGLALASVAARAADKAVAKGKDVFTGQCAVCHYAESADRKMGPGLKGLFKREKMVNGKKPNEQNVRAKIDQGGIGMPAYREMLSDEEKTDVVAYLKTL